MALMTDQHIRHLQVVDGNEIIGIVSIGNIVNGVINEQCVTIQNLENYFFCNANFFIFLTFRRFNRGIYILL